MPEHSLQQLESAINALDLHLRDFQYTRTVALYWQTLLRSLPEEKRTEVCDRIAQAARSAYQTGSLICDITESLPGEDHPRNPSFRAACNSADILVTICSPTLVGDEQFPETYTPDVIDQMLSGAIEEADDFDRIHW